MVNIFDSESLIKQSTAPLKADEYLNDGLAFCKVCNKPRQCRISYQNREYILPTPCRCEDEEFDRLERRIAEDKRLKRVAVLKKGIKDERYRAMRFDTSEHDVLGFASEYVANFKEYKRENTGLMILGTTGTGKTYAAACIANALVERCVSVYMANILYITGKMMNQFDSERMKYIESLQSYDLLIIDDFGVERETSFAMEQTYHLIETRYRSQKPLIITSNLTLQQLKTEDITLNRTYQRVIEMCHPVIMSGKSFRTNKANERYLRLKDRLK